MIRIFLVGNCQVEPIRIALSMFLPDCHFERAMLHLETDRDHESVKKRLDTSDLVLTQPVHQKNGGWSTESILDIKGKDKVITFNNMHFDGFHPDLTYLGFGANRLPATFGEYQSKIILASFLGGFDEKQCLEHFDGGAFEKMGYFSAYEESLEELARRSAEVDVPFLAEFKDLLLGYPCMLTFNHPTSNVLIDYARKLAQVVSAKTGAVMADFPVSPYNLPNFLSEGLIWPIYPALAAKHLAGKYGSLWFRCDLKEGHPRMIHVKDLIAREFKVYAQMDRAKIEKTPQFPAIAKVLNAIT